MTQQSPRKQFDQPGRQLRLAVGNPGLLDTLAFVNYDRADKPLPNEYLEIKPRSFGVNFRDVMTAMGQLNNTILGFECAGVVHRVGSLAAEHGFKVGDRVATLLRGDYSNIVRTEWTNAVQIPSAMSF